MKNYGLQIKEIPIIFRGSVDAAVTNSKVLDTFDQNISAGDWEFEDGLYFTNLNEPYESNTAYMVIRYNGVRYDNVRPVAVDPYFIYYGAPTDDDTGIMDTSVYPFQIFIDKNTNEMLLLGTEAKTMQFRLEMYEENVQATIKTFTSDITGNGQINHFRARFACGENGTLHIRPYVILNGNIRIDLCNFAAGGDQYIAGDNEEIEFSCYVPVETHAVAYIETENVGEYPSLVDAAMTVQYEDFIESESIVGYEGVNLRRGRR